jgi:hypothetical protein
MSKPEGARKKGLAVTSLDPLDPLLPHLYEGYIVTWTQNQWRILRTLAKGDRCKPRDQIEHAVTKMLCAVGGPVGHNLANIFLEAAERPKCQNAEMIDLEIQVALQDRRSPDIGVRDSVTDKLLLVAEGKRDANINGDFGYCPNASGEYSSQVICYRHECWVSPGALDDAGFLWLHPQGTSLWKGGWRERHIDNPDYVERAGSPERLRRWIDDELTATTQWKTATWEDLVAQVRDLRESPADVIANIISAWLSQ